MCGRLDDEPSGDFGVGRRAGGGEALRQVGHGPQVVAQPGAQPRHRARAAGSDDPRGAGGAQAADRDQAHAGPAHDRPGAGRGLPGRMGHRR